MKKSFEGHVASHEYLQVFRVFLPLTNDTAVEEHENILRHPENDCNILQVGRTKTKCEDFANTTQAFQQLQYELVKRTNDKLHEIRDMVPMNRKRSKRALIPFVGKIYQFLWGQATCGQDSRTKITLSLNLSTCLPLTLPKTCVASCEQHLYYSIGLEYRV